MNKRISDEVLLKLAQEATSQLHHMSPYDRTSVLKSARLRNRLKEGQQTTVQDLTRTQQIRLCIVLGLLDLDGELIPE